jgi:hypothetical protein
MEQLVTVAQQKIQPQWFSKAQLDTVVQLVTAAQRKIQPQWFSKAQ